MTDTTKQIDRAAFEKAAGYAPHEYERNETGEYVNDWMTHIWMGYQIAARATPVSAGQQELPEGWVSLSIIYDEDMKYPEEVAYGPKHLMDRLGKWLDKYMAMRIAAPAKPQSDLHSAVMAIRVTPQAYIGCPTSYYLGVHDTRLAAAELVAAAQNERAASAIWLWDDKKEQHVLAIPLAASVGAQVAGEPVYQVWGLAHMGWNDTDEATYNRAQDSKRRTLYTAPVPAPATVDRDSVIEQCAQLCDRFAAREMHPAECAGAIRMMKGKAAPAAQAAAVLSDEEAYAASGYKHFMDFDTFKKFRAECTSLAAAVPQGVEAPIPPSEVFAYAAKQVEDDLRPAREIMGVEAQKGQQ